MAILKADLKEVGKRVREIRKSLGLTQTQAGQRVGVSQDMVSAYEKGKHHPSTEYLFWAAAEGGTTVDWILTGEMPEEYASRIKDVQKRYGLNLTSEERELIELYRDAPIDGKAAARAVLEIYLPKKNKRYGKKKRS